MKKTLSSFSDGPGKSGIDSEITGTQGLVTLFQFLVGATDSEKCREIGFQRVVATERRCFVCESSATRLRVPSRAIKLQWAVEAVHGILKQEYRFFGHRIDNHLLPKVKVLFRIVSYLNNVYGKRLSSDHNLFDAVVGLMLKMKDEPNTLGEEVATKNWNRVSKPWVPVISESIPDFPEPSENELKVFFTCTYQIGQSVWYLADMLDDDDTLSSNLWSHQDNSNILMVRVPSRHRGNKQYRCYVTGMRIT